VLHLGPQLVELRADLWLVAAQGREPSAVRYKNWKFYYTMMGSLGVDALNAPTTFHWTQVQNILRDPFEQGLRAELNLGHTFAHALEAASDFFVL